MHIGEAEKASGVSQRMIRHYEAIGLIPKAARGDWGYRDYDRKDVQRLLFIRRARDLGFAIEEIRQLLELWQDRSRAGADVKALATALAEELRRKERKLQAMRRSLEELARSCRGGGERHDFPIMPEIVHQV